MWVPKSIDYESLNTEDNQDLNFNDWAVEENL